MNIANDNSSDIATNLFKRIPVEKTHYYNQLFRRRVLSHTEKFMDDPSVSHRRVLDRALNDFESYTKNSTIHPLDENIFNDKEI